MSDGRGYWGIGIYHCKFEVNQGTLWRSAASFGASFGFTLGPRFRRQSSDTTKFHRHVPMFRFVDVEDLVEHLPYGCQLVGVEIDARAKPLDGFDHPERACYLLGAEDGGLPRKVLDVCHSVVTISGASACLNVAVAGSIVMYDRTRRAVVAAPAELEGRSG